MPRQADLTSLSRFAWVMNENGCGFRAFIRQSFEAARLPFQVGVEALSVDLRMSLVARGHGIGIVTPGAFADCRWRDAVEVIDCADFKPRVRALAAASPAGGKARPADRAVSRSLVDRLKLPMPLVS